jgi:rhomboid protease GluP
MVASVRRTFAIAPVTVALVFLTVGVWLVHLAFAHFGHLNTDLTLGDNGQAIHGQWWRLITPMVVHFGPLHIGLNMLVLWRLGPPVEQVVGSRLYALAYVLSGIGGQVASDLTLKGNVLSGGASGAIYGIIGVLIGYYVAAQGAAKVGRVSTSQWMFNAGAVKSLAIQAGLWLIVGSAIAHVDSAAHAGGAVVGIVVGAGVAWARTRPAPA